MNISNKSETTTVLVSIALIILLAIGGIYFLTNSYDDNSEPIESAKQVATEESQPSTSDIDEIGDVVELNNIQKLPSNDFNHIDTSKSLIEVNKILSGGPSKDGIPSIDNPIFINPLTEDEFVESDTQGILVESEDKSVAKFYPYNILVWHEIVNDEIDGVPIAVTFCPLCGSGIVYRSEIDGEQHEFGVSGMLYQSNMLAYDRTTESLFSQIEGRAVLGEYAGLQLDLYPSQLLTFNDAIQEYGDRLQLLSQETGASRDYNRYPYGDYDENNEQFIFEVDNKDRTFELKEIFVASIVGDIPVAFHLAQLRELNNSAELELTDGTLLTATYSENSIVRITDQDGNEYPNYFTMWFSFANHNLPGGEFWGE